ncbi:hypothetical protein HPULCUR_005488 [Helicostylum pulchrum]|uniref:Uncharacterized protein n=1 Tax=Helicostylum pulchrum TaxID=562976 RepID=A0ABP9XZC1_9FUNG
MLYKRILGSTFIVSTLLLNNVLAFSIRLFSPGFDITAGNPSMFVFEGDSPKLVTFKIAVQNKDNTLTTIESLSAPNTTPGDFVRINIPSGVEPGINYWFVAVDSANELNYATMGPRVIRKLFDSDNPTASITADSGTAYKTDGGQPGFATKTTSNTTPTGPVAFPTDIFPSGLFPSGIFPSGLFPNGVYPTGAVTGNGIPSDTDKDGKGISTGAIIGIAVGGFVFVTIVLCVFYYCCIKKAVKTLAPIVNTYTRPNNMKNESSIPMVSTPSTAVINTPDIHKSPVSPSVTLVKPQKQDVFIKPGPTSPVATPNTTEYSFSASNENVYNNQYPPSAHNQQSCPPYPYPYNPNSTPQGFPYPSQDFMPMPEHFNGGAQPYPPLSPTIQTNNTFSFQQQYPSYGNQQNWDMQHSESTIVPVAVGINQTTKTEHAQTPMTSTAFNQKVKYNHDFSGKAEYNQKPDTTEHNQKPDEAVIYNKPNSETVQQYNKPHEREF